MASLRPKRQELDRVPEEVTHAVMVYAYVCVEPLITRVCCIADSARVPDLRRASAASARLGEGAGAHARAQGSLLSLLLSLYLLPQWFVVAVAAVAELLAPRRCVVLQEVRTDVRLVVSTGDDDRMSLGGSSRLSIGSIPDDGVRSPRLTRR